MIVFEEMYLFPYMYYLFAQILIDNKIMSTVRKTFTQ